MAETSYTYSLAADFAGGLNEDNLTDEIFAETGITIVLDRVEVNPAGDDGDRVDIVFRDALSAPEKTLLDNDTSAPAGGLIAAHDPVPVDPPQSVALSNVSIDGDKRLEAAVQTPSGSETMYVSHDFCDPTTWFPDYTPVVDEDVTSSYNAGEKSVTVDAGEGANPGAAKNVIIDMFHGKIHDEENWTDPTSQFYDSNTDGYKVTVKVDSTPLTMAPPLKPGEKNRGEDFANGGDFYVDYTARKIFFKDDQSGATTIEVSYCHPASSSWRLVPLAGKKLNIEKAEVQFGNDLKFVSTLAFRVKVKVHPAPVYIDGIRPTLYKTYRQIVQEGLGIFPPIPKTVADGDDGRGIPVDFWNIPFHYTRRREIRSAVALGMEVWLDLEDDLPLGGSHASVTFHCSVSDDAPDP